MKIAKLIERLGGPHIVGRMCGISRQAVYQWPRIPTRFVLTIAAQSAVTPHEMRPDIYPHPLDGTRTLDAVRRKLAEARLVGRAPVRRRVKPGAAAR